MDNEELEIHIPLCEQLLKIHRKSYERVVNGGILVDHFMSLEHGLRLIRLFYEPEKTYLTLRIRDLVSHVKQKLYSLSHLRFNRRLVKKLDSEYSDLRERMKKVINKPGTNQYSGREYSDPKRFSCSEYSYTYSLLQKIIEELMSSDCKADQRKPVMNELEHIRKILSLLEPFSTYFDYEQPRDKITVASRDKKLMTVASRDKTLRTVASLMERVTCFVYLLAVGKMDQEMKLSLKSISYDLSIEETQIMEMYLSLDVDSLETLESDISMSMRLLGWNKSEWIMGNGMGEALEDHFTSMEHGLQCLVKILKVSENEEFKLRVQQLIRNMKQTLHNLDSHPYCQLREEMKNVVFNQGTNDYDTLFPKVLTSNQCLLLEEIMELTSLKLTSSSNANQTTPIMKEIEELRKKLRSLKPLFDYSRIKFDTNFRFAMESEVVKVNVALTSFLDRATCLIYLSLVAELNEDMFVSLKENFSLLIEETEIKTMSINLGIMFDEDFESNIDISLSLIQMHEESHIYAIRQKMYLDSGIKFDDDFESNIDISLTVAMRHPESHVYTIAEAMLEDHIISLKSGIEFLKWFFNVYNYDDDFKRCIILMAGNIKQKLEFHQEDESLNMDVNGACVDWREEMKNSIIRQRAKKHDSLFQETNLHDFQTEKTMKDYLRSNYDFLVEKITTLGTSNCKADRIAPVKKELQDLRKSLNIFKPLSLYICGITGWRDKKEIFTTLLTFLHEAAFLICLTFVGTMDEEIELVRSGISIALQKTDDVLEIYTLILNQFWSEGHYKVKELYLLENLMILLKSNEESLNEGNCKLDTVLSDIHCFLLALPPNVILRKLHLLTDVLHHSIPIVYSSYLELPEVDISADFNCVLDLVKQIKSEAMEVKLYYFPEVEDLGVLEHLLLYLVDLLKNQEILLKEEIVSLHNEVRTLLSLAKSRNQEELDKNPWKDIMKLAYQAENIVDLHLVSSPKKRDLGLLSSLSDIIQQLRNLREDAHNFREDVNTLNLSDPYKYLPADGVAAGTFRDNYGIVGLEDETRDIMDDLLMGETRLNIVAITGMAGVGKTTLALTLYNSPLVARHFDIRARCVVSQSYQLRALLVSLLDQVNGSDNVSKMDDEGLAAHFCKCLKKRRYLIVLDDIWDTKFWKDLKHYLPDDGNGSRILITTRSRDVADNIGSKVNELHGLSEENSWKLFQKKILEIERWSVDLVDISKGIVRDCKGLPLSIVVVAGILSGIERTEEKWNRIAQNVNSAVLRDPQKECEAILKLSYNHLPNRLRYCFLYLGSFPEDKEISVNRLILLWIGEGFVQDTKINTAEEVARNYVEDLIVKSLVIPAKKRSGGGVKTFRLHDLMRDFCLRKAKEVHFFTLLGSAEINLPLALQDSRRIILSGSGYLARTRIDFSYHNVRSLIIHGKSDTYEIKKRIGSCDMVLLRVLEVEEGCSELFKIDNHCGIHLEDIASLVQLRYLAFHLGPWIELNSVFTSSIRKLHNLRILILIQRSGGYKVPDFIWEMVKLRHIHIDEASFEVDSNRLQNISVLSVNLQSLSVARVSYGDSNWLSKLWGLQRLHCLFTRDDPEVEDTTNSNDDTNDDSEEDDVTEVNDDIEEVDVTDVQSRMLSFNDYLISLKVKNTTGRVQRFIRTCQVPESLQKLTLSNFSLESNDISMIGKTLTHLEVFKIYSCGVTPGFEWNVEDEDFPKLKVLKLKDLKISKWIVSEESFLNLEQLWVEKCDCLDKIPIEFGVMPHLRIISLEECPASVYDSARQIEEMQHDSLNTEMTIHVSEKFILMY